MSGTTMHSGTPSCWVQWHNDDAVEAVLTEAEAGWLVKMLQKGFAATLKKVKRLPVKEPSGKYNVYLQ